MPWFAWIIVALAVLIVELALGTMYLLWIACGALAAGLVAVFFAPPWWVPWLVFSVTSLVLVAVTRPLAKKVRDLESAPSNVDSLVGKKAVVLQRIDPLENTGRVRVGSEEWRARCGEVIDEGTHVVVEAVEGTTLTVRRVTPATPPAVQEEC